MPHVMVGSVESYRREPDDVGRAEVRYYAAGLECLADAGRFLMLKGDVTTPAMILARSPDPKPHPVQTFLDPFHQVAREAERLLADALDASLREQLQ